MRGLDPGGSPADWIADGGAPARILEPWRGLPSYEDDDGLVVHANMIVFANDAGMARVGGVAVARGEVFLPRDYGETTLRQAVLDPDHGASVALHDEPGASWRWRPVMWILRADGRLERQGSQVELEWRHGLAEAQRRTLLRDDAIERARARLVADERIRAAATLLLERDVERELGRVDDGDAEPAVARAMLAMLEARQAVDDAVEEFERSTPWEFIAATERADRLLREYLSPQQRLDLEASDRFYVRGAVNPLYAIQPGNGLTIVDSVTREPTVSLCLHPERWMPHADVALAHKLLIESGEDGERQLLAGAHPYPYPRDRRRRPTREERYAADGERWLEGVS